MNPTQVQTLLDDLLDAAVAELTSPPARQFIAHGAWAFDCECVTSRLADWTLAPADERAAYPVINVITLAVAVLRCYPHSDGAEPIPDAADITTAANALARDAADLTEGLSTRWEADTLFPNVAPLEGAQVSWIGLRSLGPEGGYAGWEATVTLRA